MPLFSSPRTLTVESPAIPVVAGQPALVPLKLEGMEGINSLFEYKLMLQTPDALNFMGFEASNFDVQAWIGLELTCFVELEGQGSFTPGQLGGAAANQGAGVREISGLITAARFIGESSRHGHYEVTLRPWLHLATLNTDCKVFQDKTPVEVIERVLSDYPFASDKRLIETYPNRDYTVQYNETDFEFVTRLMQEWGINFHFEHSGGVHRLIWSDHNGAFQVTQGDQDKGASAYHSIPFYPLGHKIDREYIHGFSPTDSITSGSYASREYDYTRPRASLGANASAPRNTGHADHEVYLWRGDKQGLGGSDYSQPNRGADKAANQTEGQGKHLARLRMQTLRQPGLRAQGVGHVRGIVPGCTFSLSGHPQEKANAEYIAFHTRFLIENVGEDTQRHSAAIALSDAQRLSGQWRVLVQFEAQPATEILRPLSSQAKPKTGGPETALVVGPGADTAESNIYTDNLGRIKVQFPWDRYGEKNQNSSCWLRVSSTWAGNQLGAMQLPRIGEEVIVEFLGGDPDMGDLAKQHQAQDATDQGDVAKDIQAQNDAVQGKGSEGQFPELAEPHIVIASPAGIESTTPGNTQQHSGKHHAITSGGHTSISSNKSLLVVAKDAIRMFAYKSGMKLISASSDVNITALKTSIHLLAKMDITLTSNTIALTAKKQVLVNGGGSYMKWSAGSIEEGTAGMRVAHAGTHPVAGPKNEPPAPLAWPDVKGDDRFQVFYPDGSPVVGAKYRATLESGEVITGLTDAQGQTQLLKSALIGRYTIDVFPVAA